MPSEEWIGEKIMTGGKIGKRQLIFNAHVWDFFKIRSLGVKCGRLLETLL